MSFIQEELRNFSFKGWQSILGTGNRSTAPDNSTYYEESFANSLSIDAKSVLTDIASVPPAGNQTTADTNVSNNATIMRGFGTPASPTNAIHLTPTPNNKAFMCTSVYNNMSSRLFNFIQPQMIQNGNFASIGYTARLYNGDPNAGGVEIPTTTDQNGADVGWFFMYGAGAVIVASSFSGITNPNDVWLVCYQYIGPTAASSSSTPISAGIRLMVDKPNSDVNYLRPKMAPKSYHVGSRAIDAGPTTPENTGGVNIPSQTYLYLDDINVVNEYGFNAIYKGFNASDGYEVTMPKRFPSEFYMEGFGFNRDEDLSALGYEVEIWTSMDLNTNFRSGHPTMNHGGGRKMIQVQHGRIFTRNLFSVEDLVTSSGVRSGIYYIKLRDLNQGVEDWLAQQISIKKFPMISTDATLSADVCHGYYISTRVI